MAALPGDRARFYDREYAGTEYAPSEHAEQHEALPLVRRFVQEHDLGGKKCLEVGCGRGAFQDLVDDYTGVDISREAGKHLHKPFHVASATSLPFEDDSFEAAWTIWVFEHVADPEAGLRELRRVLRPGGVLLFRPAWGCPPWAAQGYAVRPWSELDWKGKLIKASIPLRSTVAWKAARVAPGRLLRELRFSRERRPLPFDRTELHPNLERYWQPDSDAVSWIDPHAAILWFVSRGDRCLSHPTPSRRLTVRTGGLVFRIGG